MDTASKRHPPRRSCLVCSAAKVKCIPSEIGSDSGTGDCQRCRRLHKECVMQDAAPRKPRARKKTTRVAQLEQKLDGLVQLLTSKDTEQGGYPSPESVVRKSSAQSPQTGAFGRTIDENTAASAAARPSFLAINEEDAEQCLETFQVKLTPNFPFVVIPQELFANRLRRERPALFGAIVVAASFGNMRTQIAYGEDFLRYITEELLIKGEKSLELLQALMVYTAWYHKFLHFKKRITHLTSMMSALVTDLGLSRSSAVNERLTVTFEETRGSYGCRSSTQGVRTLEERRAYLGAFFISSCISATFRDLNAFRQSAYIEDCCTTLERAAQHPTDRHLVCLLRFQNHVERTAHTFQYGSLELYARHNWRVPLALYMVPLQKDLEKLRDDLASDLQENRVLMLHYWSAMAYLFEFALYEPLQQSYFGQPSFRRMEYLYACLQAIKTFCSILFTIPASEYFHIPLFNWTQMIHAMITLSKLCFLQAEDWDVAQAREECNYGQLLEQTAARLLEARALLDPNDEVAATDNEEDMFITMGRRFRLVKSKYEKKLAADQAVPLQAPTTFPIGSNQLLNDSTMDIMSQLEDDMFWQELMGGSWPQPMMQLE